MSVDFAQDFARQTGGGKASGNDGDGLQGAEVPSEKWGN
jgi:hypothetical protein